MHLPRFKHMHKYILSFNYRSLTLLRLPVFFHQPKRLRSFYKKKCRIFTIRAALSYLAKKADIHRTTYNLESPGEEASPWLSLSGRLKEDCGSQSAYSITSAFEAGFSTCEVTFSKMRNIEYS